MLGKPKESLQACFKDMFGLRIKKEKRMEKERIETIHFVWRVENWRRK